MREPFCYFNIIDTSWFLLRKTLVIIVNRFRICILEILFYPRSIISIFFIFIVYRDSWFYSNTIILVSSKLVTLILRIELLWTLVVIFWDTRRRMITWNSIFFKDTRYGFVVIHSTTPNVIQSQKFSKFYSFEFQIICISFSFVH